MKLEAARPLALELVELLEPSSVKIRIAGSIRRGRAEVKDAEILAIPRTRWVSQVQAGLFGEADTDAGRLEVSELWELVSRLVADPQVELERHPGTGSRAAPWGPRYRKLRWKGLAVDLFTATTTTWGAQALIRTGPAMFSKAWVTELRRYGYRMIGGQVLDRDGEPVSVQGELEAFRLARWDYLKPSERVAP